MKVDITSGIVERGLDMAKDFLGKLIMPTVEEAGLLVKDQLTLWRFNNQIKILNKAQEVCKRNGITPKKVSFKLVAPLLEYSGLEDDEGFQDKWANLISNLVDSEQNIENHVFPFLLSQMSLKEFKVLEVTFGSRKTRVEDAKIAATEHLAKTDGIVETNTVKINKLNAERQVVPMDDLPEYNRRISQIDREKYALEQEIHLINTNADYIVNRLTDLEPINLDLLKRYEMANLVRLGLVKEQNAIKKESLTIDLPTNNTFLGRRRSGTKVDVDAGVELNSTFVLTELGIVFIQACQEKK